MSTSHEPYLRRASGVFVFLLLWCVAACEKKTPPGAAADAAADARAAAPPASVTPPQNAGPAYQRACYALAKARCMHLASCPTFSLVEGTNAACMARTSDVCLYAYAPKEGAVAAAAIEKCAKDQEAASCFDTLGDDLPKCEHAAGTIAEGKGCVYDAQCATQFCARERNESCGKCAPLPKEGDDCKQDRCGPTHLACFEKKCVKKKAKDEACKARGECDANLVCPAGKCVEPLAADAKCDPDGKTPECDGAVGLYCEKASKTCKAYAVANAGDPCGDKVPNKRCRADLVCKDAKCVATIRRDQPCSGPDAVCDRPSMCIGGLCRVPDVTACK
jgi:hypothetical protein